MTELRRRYCEPKTGATTSINGFREIPHTIVGIAAEKLAPADQIVTGSYSADRAIDRGKKWELSLAPMRTVKPSVPYRTRS